MIYYVSFQIRRFLTSRIIGTERSSVLLAQRAHIIGRWSNSPVVDLSQMARVWCHLYRKFGAPTRAKALEMGFEEYANGGSQINFLRHWRERVLSTVTTVSFFKLCPRVERLSRKPKQVGDTRIGTELDTFAVDFQSANVDLYWLQRVLKGGLLLPYQGPGTPLVTIIYIDSFMIFTWSNKPVFLDDLLEQHTRCYVAELAKAHRLLDLMIKRAS